jgi:hypothetical protein
MGGGWPPDFAALFMPAVEIRLAAGGRALGARLRDGGGARCWRSASNGWRYLEIGKIVHDVANESARAG